MGCVSGGNAASTLAMCGGIAARERSSPLSSATCCALGICEEARMSFAGCAFDFEYNPTRQRRPAAQLPLSSVTAARWGSAPGRTLL